jgi:hypothetical protein
MIDEDLRRELLAMQDEDFRVRDELLAANRLGGTYVPEMQAIHIKNASRLRELIALHGWPSEDLAGENGAKAAWLIAQHSIGEPDFMKQALQLTRAASEQGKLPAWHAAYLEDRIAMYEGRPQRFGSQYIDDLRDGIPRPWTLADPENVNNLRVSVGLKPLPPIAPPGPDLPNEVQEENRTAQKWWLDWLVSRDWSPSEK